MQLAVGGNCNGQRLLLSSAIVAPAAIQSPSSSSSSSSLHQRNLNFSFFSRSHSRSSREAALPRRLGLITSSSFSFVGERKSSEPPADALRRLLESPGLRQGPACFDALSAKLVEKAGFDCCFTSGNLIFALLIF